MNPTPTPEHDIRVATVDDRYVLVDVDVIDGWLAIPPNTTISEPDGTTTPVDARSFQGGQQLTVARATGNQRGVRTATVTVNKAFDICHGYHCDDNEHVCIGSWDETAVVHHLDLSETGQTEFRLRLPQAELDGIAVRVDVDDTAAEQHVVHFTDGNSPIRHRKHGLRCSTCGGPRRWRAATTPHSSCCGRPVDRDCDHYHLPDCPTVNPSETH